MAAGFATPPGLVTSGTRPAPAGATALGPFSMSGGPACPGAAGSRNAGVVVAGWAPTTAGVTPCVGLCRGGNCGCPAAADTAAFGAAAPGLTTAGTAWIAGPGAAGRVPGVGVARLNCRATAGVTPAV